MAAGVAWTSRTLAAPWAARECHTSVIDAAGAIYVLGGNDGSDHGGTNFNDVWVSTDGGAQPDRVRGWSGEYTRWVPGGAMGSGVLTGVLKGVLGYLAGT